MITSVANSNAYLNILGSVPALPTWKLVPTISKFNALAESINSLNSVLVAPYFNPRLYLADGLSIFILRTNLKLSLTFLILCSSPIESNVVNLMLLESA